MIPNEQHLEYQSRPTFSAWVGVVLLFAFFGLLALVVIGASPRGDNYEEKRAKARAEKLQAAREQTTSALTSYARVDKAKGTVRIPIEDAMKLTVAELSQRKPAPANPIVEASPAPPAAAPPAASPAPSPAKAPEPPKPTSVSGPNSENRSQPAAANNPPPAPPGTQPGPSATPVGSTPSAATKAPVPPATLPSPAVPGTPLPVPGKTP